MLTSPGFLDALKITLMYSVVGTCLSIGLGLVAALAVRKPFRGRGLVRASMLLPYVGPVVAATFVWTTMLNPQFGIVNYYGTDLLGWDEPIAFLSSSDPVSIFGFDDHVTAALERDPLRGVAVLPVRLPVPHRPDPGDPGDAGGGGHGRRGDPDDQRFRHIVLPQLHAAIAVLTVLRFIWTFNNFDDIYLLTGAAPAPRSWRCASTTT